MSDLNLKNITDICSNIVTIAAVVVGGIVAWWKWGREKPQAPRGILGHNIFLAELDLEKFVLHVALEIKNRGTVPLHVKSGWTEIRKVSPVDKDVETVLSRDDPFAGDGTEIDWPAFERRQYYGDQLDLWVDSGESESLYSDFVLPRNHQVVVIRSEISMKEDDSQTTWPITTFVRISDYLQGDLRIAKENCPTMEGYTIGTKK